VPPCPALLRNFISFYHQANRANTSFTSVRSEADRVAVCAVTNRVIISFPPVGNEADHVSVVSANCLYGFERFIVQSDQRDYSTQPTAQGNHDAVCGIRIGPRHQEP
jgi:hypothetical protein